MIYELVNKTRDEILGVYTDQEEAYEAMVEYALENEDELEDTYAFRLYEGEIQ